MKILEFIFKNIDLKTFLKLSVEGQGCSENEIIESVKDPDYWISFVHQSIVVRSMSFPLTLIVKFP